MRPCLKTLLVAAVALLAVGCAQERAPVNRVQPNYFKKSFFVGEKLLDTSDDPEFWAQGTVIDVGYGASQDGLFTSTYAQPLSRVKFVIQEKQLIARLTYERIKNSDGKGVGRASKDGIIVAVYPIESHFDIKRSYNPTTGEELNVLEENSSDRPWYEREYMRVDWSKNLNTDSYDFDTLSQMGIYGGISYEPLAYYINDPSDENAPHFAENDGYLDVTNKAFAVPGTIDLAYLGWGIDRFPSCMLPPEIGGGTAPTGNCNPVELTIRQAFRKIQDHDVEPEEWDGYKFQAFGAFTADRYGYTRNYGMTDSDWHRMIARHSIWQRSHYYDDPAAMTGAVECYKPDTTKYGEDPHRDVMGKGNSVNKLPDGTEDECQAVNSKTDANGNALHRGSRCDTFTQKCTLPFRDRETKTLAWYYTTGSNPDYFEGSRWAVLEWDVALRSAVVTARYAECMRAGDPSCSTQYPVLTGQMDDDADAVALTREVEDCRAAVRAGTSSEDCNATAVRLAGARGYTPQVSYLAQLQPMIVLCHSPVEASDPEACGSPRLAAGTTAADCYNARLTRNSAKLAECDAALNARIGDMRYHQVNVITGPQTPSPWGIMVDSVDPLTGEKVAASINVWSYVTDFWSQTVVDQARLIKGEYNVGEITDGAYIEAWAKAAAAATGGMAPRLSNAEYVQKLADYAGVAPADLPDMSRANPAFLDRLKGLKKELVSTVADASAPSATRATYEARRQLAVGSQMEAELTTKMMQQLSGLGSSADTETVLALSSPMRGANPSVLRDFRRMHELALAQRGVCVLNEAPAPLAIADLANVLEDKFGKFDPTNTQSGDVKKARADHMRTYLAQRVHYSVIAHEMGHSIGLRHNFVSSSDAFNYRPQYWQLRTQNGQVTTKCTDLVNVDNAESCVGPRYFDPVSQNEKDNLIWMWMDSSIMEYPGETTQDLMGLGAYDFGAARMFYGSTVAVHADASYKATANRGSGVISKMDNFGGLTGFQYEEAPNKRIHYSELQRAFELIKPETCKAVTTDNFKPGNWNEAAQGKWSPLVDGLMVKNVDGKYYRCRQQPVDYVQWQVLTPNDGTMNGRAGPLFDSQDRTRVPYGFASDDWADLGNLSVYRHDNGADAYELFDFFITQQETNHIFDNYRRNRTTFSVRNASHRALERYNEKMRDGVKALSLYANMAKDWAATEGVPYRELWPWVVGSWFPDNVLANEMAFNYFARQLARPAAGGHYQPAGDRVLRSTEDSTSMVTLRPSIQVNNGATGMYGNVFWGGRPVENKLADNKGNYDRDYTMNCGSYYEKAYTSMLMTESVDNFISSSRRDFTDPRYRAVSIADQFPEAYRRWLANNLTGDDEIKGPRLAADATGKPLKDGSGYPANGIGWTDWTAPTPQSCFYSANGIVKPGSSVLQLACASAPPANTIAIDPQVDWEQQRFLIAWTLLYLPENQQQSWLDMMRIWELGQDADPGFTTAQRVEFHNPAGKVYVAKTFGTETLFGRTVQRGIAARVVEYANELLQEAYETDPIADASGHVYGYEVRTDANGMPIVKFDPTFTNKINDQGQLVPLVTPGCDSTDNSKCTCNDNHACLKLQRYVEIPFFLRQALSTYHLHNPGMRGTY